MPRSSSTYAARTMVYVAVLIICIPIILITALIGICSGGDNFFHNDYGWLWFAVSGGVFILMIWLLVRLSSEWKDDGQGPQSRRF